MRLHDLIDHTDLALELLVGQPDELDRTVRSVMTTDLPDPRRFLTGGELVLTGMVWWHGPDDSAAFVGALVDAGVAAVAAGDLYHPIPADLIEACWANGLPLLRVPEDMSFVSVTDRVNRMLGPHRADDVADLIGQYRQLSDAESGSGDGLTEVLALVHRQLGLGCAVLSTLGEVVASAGLTLPAPARHSLVRSYLAAQRMPAPVTGLDDGSPTTSLYPIAGAAASRLVGWCLVVEGDCTSWSTDRHRLAGELAALIGGRLSRRSDRAADRRALADEIVQLSSGGAATAQLLAPVKAAGLPVDGPLLVVAAQATERGQTSAVLARALLEQQLPDAAVALLDDHAVAMAPAGGDRAGTITGRLRADLTGLAAGLGDDRLRLGVSGPAAGAAGLGGALDEARHACRLAGMHDGPVVVTGHEDLASHLMLLAAVPDDVRRMFRDRVLGPVLEYDRTHRAELVPTLRAFLDHAGSWTRCAGALHVHVNTLRYRIARIERLTGRDLTATADQVDFFLALSLG